MVVIAPYLLHRHRTLWQRAECSTRTVPAGEPRGDPRYAYLPFGAGPRICIGSAFALQEATLVVASIAGSFDFDLAPGQWVWPVLKVTLRPQGGLLMHVRPRGG